MQAQTLQPLIKLTLINQTIMIDVDSLKHFYFIETFIFDLVR